MRDTGLGFSTRVLESGSGAPVLLLHGNPDSAGEWGPVMRALGDRRHCLAPDLPGFGRCEEPPASFDFSREAHARFIDAVVNGVREKVTVVVHDIGGIVGLPWVAQNLPRVAGVVVTNTVVFEDFEWFPIARMWGSPTARGRLRANAGMLAIGLANGALFRRIFSKQCPELSQVDLDRMTAEFARSGVAKRSTLRLFREVLRPGFFDGYRGMLERISAAVPVHVVWGEPDPFIGPQWAERFGAQQIERARGGGHFVPLGAAAQVAQAIERVA
jgi:pimeloyl-ACP methyl ester carboxylesterase